jgi:hypothetical protein
VSRVLKGAFNKVVYEKGHLKIIPLARAGMPKKNQRLLTRMWQTISGRDLTIEHDSSDQLAFYKQYTHLRSLVNENSSQKRQVATWSPIIFPFAPWRRCEKKITLCFPAPLWLLAIPHYLRHKPPGR